MHPRNFTPSFPHHLLHGEKNCWHMKGLSMGAHHKLMHQGLFHFIHHVSHCQLPNFKSFAAWAQSSPKVLSVTRSGALKQASAMWLFLHSVPEVCDKKFCEPKIRLCQGASQIVSSYLNMGHRRTISRKQPIYEFKVGQTVLNADEGQCHPEVSLTNLLNFTAKYCLNWINCAGALGEDTNIRRVDCKYSSAAVHREAILPGAQGHSDTQNPIDSF